MHESAVCYIEIIYAALPPSRPTSAAHVDGRLTERLTFLYAIHIRTLTFALHNSFVYSVKRIYYQSFSHLL